MQLLCRATPSESVSAGSSNSISTRFRKLLSLMDEKEDHSHNGSKRRKVERSFSENDRDSELGSNPSRQIEMNTQSLH